MRVFITMLAATVVVASGCDRKMEPPSDREREEILRDAPQVFSTHNDHTTLEGLDDIYLGQSEEDALGILDEICGETMEYRREGFGQDARFRGCVLDEPLGDVTALRVGFWPKLDDRVATLEIKRTGVELDEVRERFRDIAGELRVDLYRRGLVEMRGEDYQILADLDDGADAPVHITFGYTRDYAD